MNYDVKLQKSIHRKKDATGYIIFNYCIFRVIHSLVGIAKFRLQVAILADYSPVIKSN